MWSPEPFFRVLCWTSGPPPAAGQAVSLAVSGASVDRHTFVVDPTFVLWVDARQPVSSTQPSFTALGVPLLGPRVCRSGRLEGRALTGHFLPPGHEVLVLPALPALHRGRCLFAAQHQVQEVRAPC